MKRSAALRCWAGIWLITLSAAADDPGAPSWPGATLSNGVTRLTAYAPAPDGGYYSGTRFDWSSLVGDVDVAGHSFFVAHHGGAHNPQGHDHVAGPAEEFDLEGAPPGFEAAGPGDAFLKIGVGVLRRPDDKGYSFGRAYPVVDHGTWSFEPVGGTSVVYRHEVAFPAGGLGYALDRQLTLSGDGLALHIVRRLRNTGVQPLRTRHYAHNFIRIDGHPIGSEYRVELPFTPKAVKPVPVPPAGVLDDEGVGFVTPRLERTFWAQLGGFDGRAEHHRATVRHLPSGAAVHFSGDLPLCDFRLYCNERILCPEAFVALDVAPGESVAWRTDIRFELPHSPHAISAP